MNTCSTCQYWVQVKRDVGLGQKSAHDMICGHDSFEFGGDSSDVKNDGITVDAYHVSCGNCNFITGPNFGCIHHKHTCLPVVIHQAPHEKVAVERLTRFCLELDGTVIHEFQRLEEPAGMVYPEIANDSFRWVAGLMKGKPFIWIEADCVPLKPGWAQALTDEYYRQGKEYLYPLQFNLPHDAFSGIGVQGPNAYEHAPISEKCVGFDEIIVRQHPDLIGRTDLIRHSYGVYDEKGDATLHKFPRDVGIIGYKAVLFHKDKKQGLMNTVLPGKGFEV